MTPAGNPFPLPAWKPQKLPWWAKGGKSVDDIISGTGKVLVYSGAAVIVGVAVYVTGGAITTAAGAGNGIVLAPVF